MFIYLLVEPFNSYIWDFPFFFCLSQRHRQWVPTSVSTSLMSFQAPPALCGCNWWTDPHCPAWAICLFTPTVLWQAWSGQITEQNMVFLNHKERKMSRLKVLTDSSEKRKGKQSAKKKNKKKLHLQLKWKIRMFAGAALKQRSMGTSSINEWPKGKRYEALQWKMSPPRHSWNHLGKNLNKFPSSLLLLISHLQS